MPSDYEPPWISVSDELPAVGVPVETKINDGHSDYCLIKRCVRRTKVGFKWEVVDEDHKDWNRHPPTHWQRDRDDVKNYETMIGHGCEPVIPLPEPGRMVRCRRCGQYLWDAVFYRRSVTKAQED